MNSAEPPGPDHPISQISFVVLTAERERFLPELEQRMQELVVSREWTVEPPGLFVSSAEDGRNGRGLHSGVPYDPEEDSAEDSEEYSDLPDPRMLGGYLDLYSAIFGPPLPHEVDARQFEEATALIHMLERFSIKHGLTIEVYHEHELIGEIVCGLQNESLRVLLFEEWEDALETERAKQT